MDLLDKEYEANIVSLADEAVDAIQGISGGDAELLKAAFNIYHQGYLATNKYVVVAEVTQA